MPAVSLFISGILSYLVSYIISNPKSPVNKRIPNLKFKSFQILPSVKIHIRGKIIHLHHWMHLMIIFVVSVFVDTSFLDSSLTRGFLLGGIFQGLTFSDWKKIILRKDKK